VFHNRRSKYVASKITTVWLYECPQSVGSKGFCRQNAKKCQKVQISSNILPKISNFASFSPSENEALSAVYNCYCC